jgi:hypothetical protein
MQVAMIGAECKARCAIGVKISGAWGMQGDEKQGKNNPGCARESGPASRVWKWDGNAPNEIFVVEG